ncbi:MAG: hypothetical protein HY543_07970, partial [Deltaproteobacteria bacterium]|nr:hypothetical protein [Deltaproteobacteria bacterium]
MISIIAPYRRTAAIVLRVSVCLIVAAFGHPAHAQARLKAHYTISMTGVSIGQ